MNKIIENIEEMVDERDTPLVFMLGLNGAKEKFNVIVDGHTIVSEPGNIYNYTSIFQKAIKTPASDGGGEFIYQSSKSIPHLLRLVERMSFYGERVNGSITSPRSAGGLDVLITNNIVIADKELSSNHVNSLVEEIVMDGIVPDLLVMNPRTAFEFIATLDSSNFEGTSDNGWFVSNHGKIKLVMDRWCPTDMIYVLQSDNIGFYTEREFEAYELARCDDSIKGEVIGEFSLMLTHDEYHGKIIIR